MTLVLHKKRPEKERERRMPDKKNNKERKEKTKPTYEFVVPSVCYRTSFIFEECFGTAETYSSMSLSLSCLIDKIQHPN